MTDTHKRKIIIAAIVSVFIFAAIICFTIVFDSTHTSDELITDLCDSFSFVGILYLCSGLLSLAAKNGTFNFFSYNSAILVSFLLPRFRETKQVPYYDYICQKAEKYANTRTGHLFIIGGIYLTVGIVFLIIFLTQS